MKHRIIVILLFIFSIFISFQSSAQISNSQENNKISISLYNGGYLMATGYTLGSLNYNLGAQVLYKINKKFSAVLNSDLYLEHFYFNSINKQYKITMFDVTAGINYYVPIGNGSPYFTLNTGLYRNRLGYDRTLYFPDGSRILEEDNWKSRFGINGGLGVDLKLFKNTEWTFQSKYHYLFERTKDTKFISINLGLKYNF